jgi:hypothetical protein
MAKLVVRLPATEALHGSSLGHLSPKRKKKKKLSRSSQPAMQAGHLVQFFQCSLFAWRSSSPFLEMNDQFLQTIFSVSIF